MNRLLTIAIATVGLLARPAQASPDADLRVDGFRHVGDYIVTSRLKITDAEVTRLAIKPFRLSVFTNGSEVRISTTGEEESAASFHVYRSDGIGRQAVRSAALEIVPGLQASSDQGGMLSHLRLTPACLTITRFPGVSNQTIVTHAVAAPQTTPTAAPQAADPTR